MRCRLGVALLLGGLVGLAACGSDDESPTTSTPIPPVTTLLEGNYALMIRPAAACEMPETPYELDVEVESFAGPEGDELRATLAGGDTTLVLEMLYARPGVLEGSVSTLPGGTPVPEGPTGLFIRANGTGVVTSAAGGGAEVELGTMGGEIAVDVGGGDRLTCTSLEHGWALLAR